MRPARFQSFGPADRAPPWHFGGIAPMHAAPLRERLVIAGVREATVPRTYRGWSLWQWAKTFLAFAFGCAGIVAAIAAAGAPF